jgi:hypothetical protein
MFVNTKFGKRTKFLRELSDPESLDGSPTDSDTKNKQSKQEKLD